MLRPHSDEEKDFIEYLIVKHAHKPFWKHRIFNYAIIIILAISITSVALVAYPTDNISNIPSSAVDKFGWSELTAIETSETIIKEQLAYPSTAQFSNEKAMIQSENIGFNKYRITGNVESLNSYNLKIKKSFYVVLLCYSNSYYEIVESGLN